ncbi:hypothetical protein [Amycolatopsis nigrescens]|nr:hypothetical protein [Amycolatopsis nigrescens]
MSPTSSHSRTSFRRSIRGEEVAMWLQITIVALVAVVFLVRLARSFRKSP